MPKATVAIRFDYSYGLYMTVRPFHEVLAAQDLDLGLSPDLLEFIKEQTLAGARLDELLEREPVSRTSLGPGHLLEIRLSAWRFGRLESAAKDLPEQYPVRNVMELQALRWAVGKSRTQSIALPDLFPAAMAMASFIMKKGRVRMHLLNPRDPMSEEFSDLAEHTEGLDDFPPHRWFKASRGVAARLLWLEIIVPEEKATDIVHLQMDEAQLEDMRRSMEKPVLDTIADTAQKKVVTAAAQAMLSMLSTPPIKGPVAGILIDGKHAYASIVDDEFKSQHLRTDIRELDKLVAWLSDNDARSVAMALLKTSGSIRGLMNLLQKKGIPGEPASMAGVMKQARTIAGQVKGPLKQAAAQVLAHRHKNPIRGTEDMEPDELGIGEYLDRVDQDFLRFALNDALKAALIMVRRSPVSFSVRAAGSLNPMVKSMKDLRPGMDVGGVIVNLTHFGAFVDLGLEQQGLVHISEISDSRIDHPSQALKVGQRIRAKVLQVDIGRGRISLSMREGGPSRKAQRHNRSHALDALDQLFSK